MQFTTINTSVWVSSPIFRPLHRKDSHEAYDIFSQINNAMSMVFQPTLARSIDRNAKFLILPFQVINPSRICTFSRARSKQGELR